MLGPQLQLVSRNGRSHLCLFPKHCLQHHNLFSRAQTAMRGLCVLSEAAFPRSLTVPEGTEQSHWRASGAALAHFTVTRSDNNRSDSLSSSVLKKYKRIISGDAINELNYTATMQGK